MVKRDLILGIDGGGTTSKVVLFRQDGRPVESIKIGSLSCKSVGPQVVAAHLQELMAIIAPYERYIVSAVAGLSGLDSMQDYEVMVRLLIQVGLVPQGVESACFNNLSCPQEFAEQPVLKTTKGFPLVLTSDAVLPLYACNLKGGVVLIAGTGSVAVNILETGHILRFGGWGYLSSDEGSGTWIGREFLRVVLKAADRIRAQAAQASKSCRCSSVQTAFQDSLAKHSETSEQDKALIEEAWNMISSCASYQDVHFSGKFLRDKAEEIEQWALSHTSPEHIASLARYVLESNSETCKAITQQATERLTQLLAIACSSGSTSVVIAGGLFANKEFIVELENKIKSHYLLKDATVAYLEKPPVTGAYKMALSLFPFDE